MQSGARTSPGSGRAGSAGKAGIGKSAGKPSPDQLKMLAAKFRNRTAEGEVERISVTLDIAELSAVEIGPLLEELLEAGDVGDVGDVEDVGDADWGILNSLAVRWGMLDPKAALAFAVGRKGLGDDPDVMASIVGELAKVDSPAAKSVLGSLREAVREEAGLAIVRHLQDKDPHATLAYARELGNDDAEAAALSCMAEKDPLAAAAELTPGKSGQQRAVKAIASALMTKDRAAFEGWMESLRDPEWRVTALGTALSDKFQPDPKSAALEASAWLAKDPEMLKEAGELLRNIARRWMEGKGAPAEVTAWAAGLPEGRVRDAAVLEAGRLWMDQDTMTASHWLSTLPPGGTRDRAVESLVEKIRSETPADAFEWARTVETPDIRDNALAGVALVWAKKDPDAAEKALETLPTKEKDRIGGLFDMIRDMAEARSATEAGARANERK